MKAVFFFFYNGSPQEARCFLGIRQTAAIANKYSSITMPYTLNPSTFKPLNSTPQPQSVEK